MTGAIGPIHAVSLVNEEGSHCTISALKTESVCVLKSPRMLHLMTWEKTHSTIKSSGNGTNVGLFEKFLGKVLSRTKT